VLYLYNFLILDYYSLFYYYYYYYYKLVLINKLYYLLLLILLTWLLILQIIHNFCVSNDQFVMSWIVYCMVYDRLKYSITY